MIKNSNSDFVAQNFSDIMVNGEIEAIQDFELDLLNRQKKIGFWCVMGSRAFGVHRPDSEDKILKDLGMDGEKC